MRFALLFALVTNAAFAQHATSIEKDARPEAKAAKIYFFGAPIDKHLMKDSDFLNDADRRKYRSLHEEYRQAAYVLHTEGSVELCVHESLGRGMNTAAPLRYFRQVARNIADGHKAKSENLRTIIEGRRFETCGTITLEGARGSLMTYRELNKQDVTEFETIGSYYRRHYPAKYEELQRNGVTRLCLSEEGKDLDAVREELKEKMEKAADALSNGREFSVSGAEVSTIYHNTTSNDPNRIRHCATIDLYGSWNDVK